MEGELWELIGWSIVASAAADILYPPSVLCLYKKTTYAQLLYNVLQNITSK